MTTMPAPGVTGYDAAGGAPMDDAAIARLLRDALPASAPWPEARRALLALLEAPAPALAIRKLTDEDYLDWLEGAVRAGTGLELRAHLRVPVWVLPDTRVSARVVTVDARTDIVLTQGMLHVLAFWVSFHASVARRAEGLASSPHVPGTLRHEIETTLLEALNALNALVIQSLHAPVPLPDFRRTFSKADAAMVGEHLVYAGLFLLLHENAHVVLGHHALATGEIPDVSARAPWIAEPESPWKEREYEADACAFEALPAPAVEAAARGAFHVLGLTMYHEMWARRLGDSHPLSLNRMRAICRREEVARVRALRSLPDSLDRMRQVFEGRQAFAHDPLETVRIMLQGRTTTYACDFLDWYSGWLAEIAGRYPASGA
jgi:hypothetical protein